MTTAAYGLDDEIVAPEAPKATRKTAAKGAGKMSILDRVRADAAKSLSRIVTYEVTTRPGYKVSFDVNIEKDDVERWTKNAQGKKKRPEDMNTLQMAAQALIESNRHILLDGIPIEDSEDDDMTLGNDEWTEIFGGEGSILALRAFMGDGLVQSMGLAVLKEAGYGDGSDLYAEDGLPDPKKA